MYKNSSNFIDLQKPNQLLKDLNKIRPNSIGPNNKDPLKNLNPNPLNTLYDNQIRDGQTQKQLDSSEAKKQMPRTQANFADKSPNYLPKQGKDFYNAGSLSSKNKGLSSNEYQSTLLSRFLKEPRLPPSSNIVQKRKSQVNKSMRPAPYKLNQTDSNNLTSGQGSQSQKKNFKQPVISYRNQSEIMKKIFGNEQNYNQVKSLFQQTDEKYNSNSYKTPFRQQPYQEDAHSFMRAQSTPDQVKNQEIYQNQHNNQVLLPKSSPKYAYASNDQRGEEGFSRDQRILAESREKLEQADSQSKSRVNEGGAGSDQVEKAIFDLQDVKNNYYQEKSLYDNKIQQIQIKQQNTVYGGFLQSLGQTNKTSSGFFNSTNRPMTQGGRGLYANHPLIADDNVLKDNLDHITKEDLKERLVVAEMVMKKLFQRNKDLEDSYFQLEQQQNKADKLNSFQNDTSVVKEKIADDDNIANKQPHKSQIQQQVEDGEAEGICQGCVGLRKELAENESEMQKKINELQLQILNMGGKKSEQEHLNYLKIRLEETMNEAKRHFNNYLQIRNSYNSFLESRLNSQMIAGGMKGQKLQSDILMMLKKNLENEEKTLQEEQIQIKKSFQKVESVIDQKDKTIIKKSKRIQSLKEEIDRRQFLEAKVQKYVKGLINQNQRCVAFIQQLKENQPAQNKVEEFLRNINNKEYDENEGESTENEIEEDGDQDNEEAEQQSSDSLQVNDL